MKIDCSWKLNAAAAASVLALGLTPVAAQIPGAADGYAVPRELGIGLAVGTAIGAVFASVITAIGVNIWKPWLEQHGFQKDVAAAKARIAELEKSDADERTEIASLRTRIGSLERDNTGLVANLADITDRNVRLSQNLLIIMGRQKPGPAFGAEILISDSTHPKGTGAKVLLVEDNPQAKDVVAGLLDLAGFQVEAVATLAEANEALDRFRPAWVVLDLMLPDGRGEDLLRRVRQENLPVKVAVVTGKYQDSTGKDLLEEVRSLKPEALFIKPFDFPNDLLPLLRGTKAAEAGTP